MTRYSLVDGNMVENVIWDGEQFIANDDAERWIGAAWPSPAWVRDLELSAGYAATRLADLVLDGADPDLIAWQTESYARARSVVRHANAVYEHLHNVRRSADWRAPGALIR